MAEQQAATYSTKPLSAKQKDKDFSAHTGTYQAFMKWTVRTIVSVAILLIGMYIFLVA